MPQPALIAHDLTRTLGTRRILDGVSLTAAPGRRIGLIGENGVGKSTLLRLLAGEDTPTRAASSGRPTSASSNRRRPTTPRRRSRTCWTTRCARPGPNSPNSTGSAIGSPELRRTPTPTPNCSTPMGSCSSAPGSTRHGTRTGAPRSPSPVSTSGRSRTPAPWVRSPAASADGSPWPRCSYAVPPRCCSTSRRTISTTTQPCSWRNRCGRCRAWSSSPATTGRSSTPSARTSSTSIRRWTVPCGSAATTAPTARRSGPSGSGGSGGSPRSRRSWRSCGTRPVSRRAASPPTAGRATTRRWATASAPTGCRARSHAGSAMPPAASRTWSAHRSPRPRRRSASGPTASPTCPPKTCRSRTSTSRWCPCGRSRSPGG